MLLVNRSVPRVRFLTKVAAGIVGAMILWIVATWICCSSRYSAAWMGQQLGASDVGLYEAVIDVLSGWTKNGPASPGERPERRDQWGGRIVVFIEMGMIRASSPGPDGVLATPDDRILLVSLPALLRK